MLWEVAGYSQSRRLTLLKSVSAKLKMTIHGQNDGTSHSISMHTVFWDRFLLNRGRKKVTPGRDWTSFRVDKVKVIGDGISSNLQV